jgi:hypothetical protein
MRAFLFEASTHQAVTTDQAGSNLPRSDYGDWRFRRALDTRELAASQIKVLETEGLWIKPNEASGGFRHTQNERHCPSS